MVNKLFDYCKHLQSEISIENCCLKIIFADVYHLQRSCSLWMNEVNSLCLWCCRRCCDVNYLINILFAICMNLSKDIMLMMLTSCMNEYKDNILANDVDRLLRCLKWFINCKRVVDMFVNNDMNLLRIMISVVKLYQQVVWLW